MKIFIAIAALMLLDVKAKACDEIQAFNYDSSCYSDQLTIIDYDVKEGDTLIDIANRFHVSVQNIMEWNDIENEDLILAGQTLRVRQENNDEKRI